MNSKSKMDSINRKERPHAVCIPFPTQGSINPMMKLAKLLHSKGFHVTFVNTEFNHNRILKSRGPHALDGLSSFHFQNIPDGLPPNEADSTQDMPSICDATSRLCLVPFRDLLIKLNSCPDNPPVTCVVSAGCMSFTLAAAEELGIPNVLFWTMSGCGFLGFLHYKDLVEKGYAPLEDESYLTNGYLNAVIDWIPAMKGVRLKDLPSFFRTTNPDDIVFNFMMREAQRAHKGTAVVINTFDDLERGVLDSIKSILKLPVYSIGSLELLLGQIPQSNTYKAIGSNLWKEDVACFEWLDSKEANSVMYVNFGSITVMTAQQMIEFAWGLANSKKDFLWVIRPDLVVGESAVLPPEFSEATENRRYLTSWCLQEKVLGHPAIGGFLTHCGWNSMIESIVSGVPMLCWPFFADQQTNCFFSCNDWGIGMEIDSTANRDEIEGLVRELMDGEKGRETKRKVLEWKRLAGEAIIGSSLSNFDKLVEIMSPSSPAK